MSDPVVSDISTIQSSVTQLSADYASAVQSFQSQLAALQAQLTTAQQSDQADQATIASLQAQIASVQSQLSAAQQTDQTDQATITSLNAQITALQNQIATMQAPPSGTLTVMPSDLPNGPGNVTLTWTSAGGNASIDNGIGPVAASGSMTVPVSQGTTFNLTITPPVVAPATASASVTVETPAPPPPPPPPSGLTAPSFPWSSDLSTLPPPPTQDPNKHPIVYTTPTPDPTISTAIPATGDVVEIKFSTGETFVYIKANGKDLGDYVGQFVQQHCVSVTRPDCGLTVDFRADVSQARDEIVIWNGKMWGAANAAACNVPGYTATYYRNGAVLAKIACPYHWWFARWRWQSAPRPIVRTPAQVMALFPKFGLQVKNLTPTTISLILSYPMGNALGPNQQQGLDGALDLGMGAPGDRNELGLVTEPQAIYMLLGDKIALNNMFQQAECANSIPVYQRDETTGGPVNFLNHPKCWWSPAPAKVTGEEWVRTIAANAPVATATTSAAVASVWGIEDSHFGALSFVPYMLTDDPYHGESVQYQSNWTIGFEYYHRVNDGAINGVYQPVFSPSEVRGYDWDVRTGAESAYISPVLPPAWFLAQSVTTQILSINLNYFLKVLTNPSNPTASGWHLVINPSLYSGFMYDYGIAYAHAVKLGFAGWMQALEAIAWLPKQLALNTGWNLQWSVPYEIYNIARAASASAKGNLIAGQTSIGSLSTTLGLVAGMNVSGLGVAPNTTLVNNAGVWALSQPASAGGIGIALTFSGTVPADTAGVAFNDFKGLWNKYKLNWGIDESLFPTDGSWAQGKIANQSAGYTGERKAFFNVLAQMGDPDAPTCLANVGAMFDQVMIAAGGYPFRWSFAAS